MAVSSGWWLHVFLHVFLHRRPISNYLCPELVTLSDGFSDYRSYARAW